MKTAELGGPILRAVSRSFYLSIRLLPARLRAPIGLAYLLARTSDTIADSASAPVAARLAHLDSFQAMVKGGSREGLAKLRGDLEAGCSVAEMALLTQIGPCLDWLEALNPFDREEIEGVLETIIHGQRLDLERFGGATPGAVVALATSAELEEYAYLVAGCVGEFWTRECRHWLPRFSRLGAEELSELGRDFGKGLQLVNILRDLPQDLRQGRCYLPREELQSEGLSPADLLERPVAARPIFNRWLERARELLDRGGQYVAAVRPARVRMGCYLPWSLGGQTLDLLAKHPPLETAERVKVSRQAVTRTMWRAAWAGLSKRGV